MEHSRSSGWRQWNEQYVPSCSSNWWKWPPPISSFWMVNCRLNSFKIGVLQPWGALSFRHSRCIRIQVLSSRRLESIQRLLYSINKSDADRRANEGIREGRKRNYNVGIKATHTTMPFTGNRMPVLMTDQSAICHSGVARLKSPLSIAVSYCYILHVSMTLTAVLTAPHPRIKVKLQFNITHHLQTF